MRIEFDGFKTMVKNPFVFRHDFLVVQKSCSNIFVLNDNILHDFLSCDFEPRVKQRKVDGPMIRNFHHFESDFFIYTRSQSTAVHNHLINLNKHIESWRKQFSTLKSLLKPNFLIEWFPKMPFKWWGRFSTFQSSSRPTQVILYRII